MATLWGDGFADDGFAAFCAVSTWDDRSPDEYAMLFPRLVATGRAFAPALRRHLEACIAARAWRLTRLAPNAPAFEVRSSFPGADAGELHRAWFADDGAVGCLLRQMGLLRTPPARISAERRLLALLDALLDAVQRGDLPTWSADAEAWVAYGSGIHPAYLWPESAISAERGMAAAWLGHLDRGRAALMPPAVAEYLADAVLAPSGARDRTLIDMVGSTDDERRLRRAVALKLAGRDPVTAFGRGRRAAFGMARRAPAPREKAFERA